MATTRTAKDLAAEAFDRAENAAHVLIDGPGGDATRSEGMLLELALSLSALSRAVGVIAEKQRL